MKRLLVVTALFTACASAQVGVTASTNGTTQVIALLLGGADPAHMSGVIAPYGVMVTACDSRPEILGYSVRLTGLIGETTIQRKAVFGYSPAPLGCMTTWFENTGKLTELTVTAEPLWSRGDLVVAK